MQGLADHPRLHALNAELHARPFPTLPHRAAVAYLALTRTSGRGTEADTDLAALVALLDRFGAPHPGAGANHWAGELGRFRLKWERHSEIITYTLIDEEPASEGFLPELFEVFPTDWLEAHAGQRVASALCLIEPRPAAPEEIEARIGQWFARESVAVSCVLDDNLTVATDLRLDPAGHVRIALFADPDTPPRRIGRATQRMLDLVTYIHLSLLGLETVRGIASELDRLEAELTALADAMAGEAIDADATLHALLSLASELERMRARHGFRFAATAAYSAIVHERIALLRESRFRQSQMFAEFIARRFQPAMRTVASAEQRLDRLAERARRAGELLRTRVDVQRTAQNQKLLESLDTRAATQLHLQKSVEGLSLVAISYYALSLAVYALAPLAKGLGIDKTWLAAGLVPPVMLAVWLVVRQIRKSVHG